MVSFTLMYIYLTSQIVTLQYLQWTKRECHSFSFVSLLTEVTIVWSFHWVLPWLLQSHESLVSRRLSNEVALSFSCDTLIWKLKCEVPMIVALVLVMTKLYHQMSQRSTHSDFTTESLYADHLTVPISLYCGIVSWIITF